MAIQSTPMENKGLEIKDLVTIGIFTALFFIFELIGSIPFAPNPALTFYQPFGIALLCGPIFLLMTAKVPKFGAITILGIVNGIIWFVMGMHWAMDLGYVIMGAAADLVAWTGKHKSVKMNILAYALFCTGPGGVLIAYAADPAGWASTMLSKGLSQEYVDSMAAAVPGGMIAGVFLGTLAIALISGILGRAMLKKQFEKAGITK